MCLSLSPNTANRSVTAVSSVSVLKGLRVSLLKKLVYNCSLWSPLSDWKIHSLSMGCLDVFFHFLFYLFSSTSLPSPLGWQSGFFVFPFCICFYTYCYNRLACIVIYRVLEFPFFSSLRQGFCFSIPGCLGICSVDEASFELRDQPSSGFWAMGLKVCMKNEQKQKSQLRHQTFIFPFHHAPAADAEVTFCLVHVFPVCRCGFFE